MQLWLGSRCYLICSEVKWFETFVLNAPTSASVINHSMCFVHKNSAASASPSYLHLSVSLLENLFAERKKSHWLSRLSWPFASWNLYIFKWPHLLSVELCTYDHSLPTIWTRGTIDLWQPLWTCPSGRHRADPNATVLYSKQYVSLMATFHIGGSVWLCSEREGYSNPLSLVTT